MEVIEQVRKCKLKNNLPILDSTREKNMKDTNKLLIKNQEFVSYYEDFLKSVTTISKQYMKNKNSKL